MTTSVPPAANALVEEDTGKTSISWRSRPGAALQISESEATALERLPVLGLQRPQVQPPALQHRLASKARVYSS